MSADKSNAGRPSQRIGKQTVRFSAPPAVASFAAVASKKEREGPLGACFDYTDDDMYFGQDSWEKAESFMQEKALTLALEKSALTSDRLGYLLAGDLLNQSIASTYGLRVFPVPFLGLWGACSSSALGSSLAAMLVAGGYADYAAAVTSSHFATAERQFRFPMQYGSQRAPSSQWTATASGAVIIGAQGEGPYIRHITTGRITDMGITDLNNMGAAMAPAAAATLSAFFSDTGTTPEAYDLIVTGDLGRVGKALLIQLLGKEGLHIATRHGDCGLMLYDAETQDVEAGGSGCGCSACVLCGKLLPELRSGSIKELLYIATGALMSPTSSQQGESIPGIAHLIHFSHGREQ